MRHTMTDDAAFEYVARITAGEMDLSSASCETRRIFRHAFLDLCQEILGLALHRQTAPQK